MKHEGFFQGLETILYDSVMYDTMHFPKLIELYVRKSESYCTYI